MKKCPGCGSESVYQCDDVSAGGAWGPHLLPGLGAFSGDARFTVLVCSECGLTQFFANEAARNAIESSGKWKKV